MKTIKRNICAAAISILIFALCLALPQVSDAQSYQDGSYSVSVGCEGGSGRGGVRSADIVVSSGSYTVTFYMSSANYTRARINGGDEIPAVIGSVSSFTTALYDLDAAVSLSAETTAMSEPHWIDYTVTIDTSGIPAAGSGEAALPGGEPNQGASAGGGPSSSSSSSSDSPGSGAAGGSASPDEPLAGSTTNNEGGQTEGTDKERNDDGTVGQSAGQQPADSSGDSRYAGGERRGTNTDKRPDTGRQLPERAAKKPAALVTALIVLAVIAAITAFVVLVRKGNAQKSRKRF